MTDEGSVEDLRHQLQEQNKRIEQLEAAIKKMMPGRRDVLKAGIGAAFGAAGLSLTGNAAAGSQSAGTWGTQSKPQDGYAEDLFDRNGNTVMSFPGDGAVDIAEGAVTDEELGLVFGSQSNSPRVASARGSARGSLTVQPIGGNSAGSVELYPGPTGDRSHFLAGNAPDPANFGFVELECQGSEGWIHAAAKGSGTVPASFRFYGFTDGITFDNDISVNGTQGSPSSPNNWIQHGSGPDATGMQNASTDVVADNTGTTILDPDDPPFGGLAVVIGDNSGGNQTFTDVVSVARNDAVQAMQKTDGNGTPGPRTYSLSGSALQVTIDEGGESYHVAVIQIGGGT